MFDKSKGIASAIVLTVFLFFAPYGYAQNFKELKERLQSLKETIESDFSISITPKKAPSSNSASIEIDDPVFKSYCLSNFDSDKDGKISLEEAAAVKTIDVDSENIKSLKGIEYFKNISELFCSCNQLTSLDVSKNTELVQLFCYENRLTSLDISKNTGLVRLICDENQLTSLDVSKNTELNELYCDSNQLTSLDVSKNTKLRLLSCNSNKLTSLDVSKNTELNDLNCGRNQLTSLDVSKNTVLNELNCGRNQLTSLDVSKNTGLFDLNCDENQLTSLDVSKNTKLYGLNCGRNQLTSLDVSNNPELRNLYCNDNLLTSLDISRHTNLSNLNYNNNKIKEGSIKGLEKGNNSTSSNSIVNEREVIMSSSPTDIPDWVKFYYWSYNDIRDNIGGNNGNRVINKTCYSIHFMSNSTFEITISQSVRTGVFDERHSENTWTGRYTYSDGVIVLKYDNETTVLIIDESNLRLRSQQGNKVFTSSYSLQRAY